MLRGGADPCEGLGQRRGRSPPLGRAEAAGRAHPPAHSCGSWAGWAGHCLVKRLGHLSQRVCPASGLAGGICLASPAWLVQSCPWGSAGSTRAGQGCGRQEEGLVFRWQHPLDWPFQASVGSRPFLGPF